MVKNHFFSKKTSTFLSLKHFFNNVLLPKYLFQMEKILFLVKIDQNLVTVVLSLNTSSVVLSYLSNMFKFDTPCLVPRMVGPTP